MVVVDEKPPMLPPPPPYNDAVESQSPYNSRFQSRNPFRNLQGTSGPTSSLASGSRTRSTSPSAVGASGGRASTFDFTTLPSQLLLEIVWHTFPQQAWRDEGRVERQRKTLYWLSVGLRLVNRALYVACMHVLRSTYLPAYTSLLRFPYSSDPFPHSAPSYIPIALSLQTPSSPSFSVQHTTTTTRQPNSPSPANSTTSLSSTSSIPRSTNPNPSSFAGYNDGGPLLPSMQRETHILDLFIALKVREDVWADDTELHLEREESFRDLFDLMQPRARTEDLVREYGVRKGVIVLSPPGNAGGHGGKMVEWSRLSISFSSRRVGLVLSPASAAGGRKRSVVEVQRTRDEKLEIAARRLVRGLRSWLEEQ